MIIKSILDTDLYKLSMQVAVIKHFPNLRVKYVFIDRNKISFPDNFDKDLIKEVKEMEKLFLTKNEKVYLYENIYFLPRTYIDFLEGYRFDSNELKIYLDKENKLHIEIEGYWYRTILWEVPLMALISELYFIKTGQIIDIYDKDLKNKDLLKINSMIEHNAFLTDFGTRRRYSFDNQERIVKLFSENGKNVFVGTSNVYLAYKYNIKCTGTLAHELVMVHAALYGYRFANKMAMDTWINTYNGNLGTMLPDTYTLEIFLKSFDSKYARLFDSVRHDSGDPFIFVDKMIEHYKKLNIDPMSKVLIFSDGLDVKLATKIKEYCVGKIKSSFGIGTNLTSDVGVKPLNIVIKISEVLINDEWFHTVKLSDNNGKHTGNIEEIDLCKKTLKLI
jgi:nicotinate phosphoribosyltransferase